MNEFIQIIFTFFVFQLFLFLPLNVLKKKNYSMEISAFNLILNLNILLIFSLLPIPINKYSDILIIIYFLIFLKKYIINQLIFNLNKKIIDFFIFFIIFIIISINISGNLNLGWDAKYFYYIKSLFFIEEQTFYDLKNFSHNAWHPHLGSFIWSFFWNLSFSKIEYFGRLFYAFIFIFSVLYLSDNFFIKKKINLIIFLLLIICSYSYDKFSGLQEILIFSLLIIMSKLFDKLNNQKNNSYVIFILLTCNLLTWIKAEGIVYALILIILLNISRSIKLYNKFRLNGSFLILFLIKVILYKNSNIPLNAQPYFIDYILNLNYEFIIYKIKFIFIYLTYYILKNIFFTSGILIILFNNIFLKKIDDYIKLINIYLLLNLIFIFLAYLLRDMDIEYSLKTTMERIIFMSSGFYLFNTLLFFKNYEYKKKR